MRKTTAAIEEVTVDDMYETEISDDDYGFILGPNGELKSVFMPEVVPFKQPKNIQKILKIFGVHDIERFNGGETLH
jgi:hypothetical protein